MTAARMNNLKNEVRRENPCSTTYSSLVDFAGENFLTNGIERIPCCNFGSDEFLFLILSYLHFNNAISHWNEMVQEEKNF